MERERGFITKMLDTLTSTDKLVDLAGGVIVFSIRLMIALLVFIILRKLIDKIIDKYSEFNNKDNKSLHTFSRSMLKLSLNFVVIMIALLILGVKETAFVGLLGGAGLGIALALKDTLANFAGGVILILFKAYEIGDFIEIDGQKGTVHEINVFATIMNTVDNKRILVPNGLAAGNQIINYTKNKMRRVDILFGISYGADFREAIVILNDIADKHELINQSVERKIRLKELGDSSVNITFRVWCKSSDYWEVYYDVMEETKLRFDESGIGIPFPQMDVHLHKIDEEVEKKIRDEDQNIVTKEFQEIKGVEEK